MSFIDDLGQQTGMGAATTATSDILGMIMGGYNDKRQLAQQGKLQAQQIQGQEQLMNYGYDTQMKMWNATNYPAQMQQLEKAGLNPGLMYAKGGAGGQTGSPVTGVQGGQAQQNPGEQNPTMGIMSQNALIDSQRKNIDADTALKQSQVPKTEAETGLTIAETGNITVDTELKKVQTDLSNIQKTIQGATIEEQIRQISQDAALRDEEVMQAGIKTTLDRATLNTAIDSVRAAYAGLMIENALKSANINLTAAEITKIHNQILQDWQKVSIEWKNSNSENQKVVIDKFIANYTAAHPEIGKTIGGILNTGIENIMKLTTGQTSIKPDQLK